MIRKIECVGKNMEKQYEERIDDLQLQGLKIIQNPEWFCYGVDSVLLANFASEIRPKSKVIDFGCGNGILELLLSAKTKAQKIWGVEIQEDVANLAKRNIKLNHLEDRVEILQANVKKLDQYFSQDTFDAVISNPPYMKADKGLMNENRQKRIARHEMEATLEDFVRMSFFLLKDKKPLYMIYRTERLVDLIACFRQYKIEPKEIRMIQSKMGQAPQLFLVKGIKNAGIELRMKEPLVVYEKDGEYTEEILKIYERK